MTNVSLLFIRTSLTSLKEVPSSKFEMQYKTKIIFHLILLGIPSSLILNLRRRGEEWGGFCLLNGQNLLSMAKVICRQYLFAITKLVRFKQPCVLTLLLAK